MSVFTSAYSGTGKVLTLCQHIILGTSETLTDSQRYLAAGYEEEKKKKPNKVKKLKGPLGQLRLHLPRKITPSRATASDQRD